MLFPYNTDAPIYHPPVVTVGMIVVNLAIFFGTIMNGDAEQIAPWTLYHGDGLHPLQWITSNFVHGSVMHVLGNMLFVWVFGLVVEGKLGWWRFLLIYLGIGFVQCGAEQLITLGSEESISYGASSIVFGLIAMVMVWAPKNEMYCVMIFYYRPHFIEVSYLTFGLIYCGLEVLAGRLHQKSCSAKDLKPVVIVPGGAEAFVLHADLFGLVVFQQAEGRSSRQAEVGVGMPLADA